MNTIKSILSVLFCFGFLIVSAQQEGVLNGFVRNIDTQVPIENVIIRVVGSDFGAVTDSTGFYRISKLPVKAWTIEASAFGYKGVQKFDIPVTTGNASEVNFELQESANELAQVEVKSNFFKPAGAVNSIQSLGINEIAKYPGANFDMAKVVQSLPGVSGSVGFRNDIIIRGGAPNENVYFLDGIEIPSINHFATQGASGGPVGLLNVSFIESVTLHTSAFPAKYDNPLSGVLVFKQRTGNPQRVQSNFRLSASEAALTTEGPLGKKGGATTFIGSVRRSYLKLIFQLIDLPFIPDYWDYQYKISHKPNTKNEFNFLGIGAIDNFTFIKPKDLTLEKMAILDQIPLNSQQSNTVGASWRHAMDKGYFLLALSDNRLFNTASKYQSNAAQNESNQILRYSSLEEETRLKMDVNHSAGSWQSSFGTVLIYSNYSNSTFQRRAGYKADFSSSLQFFRYGAFFQINRRAFDNKLLLTAGSRVDGNSFTQNGDKVLNTFAPRVAVTYNITPEFNTSFSLGRYYKILPYTILGYQENDQYVNRKNDYTQSDHVVTGFEWLPSNSIRITLEGFYKRYNSYPVSVNNEISLANLGGDFGVLGNERVSSNGRGKTYGAEFMLQKRLTSHIYGILAYTYYYSLFTGSDPTKYIPSAWDNRQLVSFTGGYKFAKNWELGLRFRYQGKTPSTPYDLFKSLENYPFTNQPVLDYGKINSERLSAFNAADLRIDKKWNFKHATLDLFMDIQNFYNSKNPIQPGLTLKRNPDNSIATTAGVPYNPGTYGNPSDRNNRQSAIPVILPNTSGSILPSMGFVIEF